MTNADQNWNNFLFKAEVTFLLTLRGDVHILMHTAAGTCSSLLNLFKVSRNFKILCFTPILPEYVTVPSHISNIFLSFVDSAHCLKFCVKLGQVTFSGYSSSGQVVYNRKVSS